MGAGRGKLSPHSHYTVFKRKRYCFVPDTATVHTATTPKTGDQRKRIVSQTLSRLEQFENDTVWKCCFSSVDGENEYLKTMTSAQQQDWAADWKPRVSKMSQVASLLIAVNFSLLMLLEAHLTLLRLLFDFSKREQDIIRLFNLPASGGTRKKTTRSKPAKTWMVLDKTRTNFSVVE